MSSNIDAMLRSLLGGSQSGKDNGSSVLESKDLPGLAKYIKSKECRNVFVMVSPFCRRYPLASHAEIQARRGYVTRIPRVE